MKLIVDANILFAALIKDSYTSKMLFNENFDLCTADYILTEFSKHKKEILRKTERSEEEFYRFLEILKKKITLFPTEELRGYINEAEKITPDPDDMVYFALALKLNCAIWSNDKKLKEQDKVRIYFTHELSLLF